MIKTMKKILIVLLIATSPAVAQDVFKEHLYTPDLIFKYREKISLTEDQAAKIKEVYNNSTLTYNNFKWDLDARMIKLEETLNDPKVDIEKAENQLQEIVRLENEIKRMRLRTMLVIKNTLTEEQQATLDTYKDEMDEGYEIMTSVNQDPRVVVRVEGEKKDNKEPLYLIREGNKTREVKDLSMFDPNQIQSIEVLKGEAATDKYGDRAKNGVVIIELKQ